VSAGGRRGLRVLIATDGSPSARAALAAVAAVPWPAGTRARAVVAAPPARRGGRPQYVHIAFRRAAERVAEDTRRALAARWPQAEARVVDARPEEAIPAEAARFRADVVALGWRGHGTFRRLLMGSVSRAVVRRAPCAVLVVRRGLGQVRRVVVGVDASPDARRAVALLARLAPGRGARIRVVSVVAAASPPSGRLLPASVKDEVLREMAAAQEGRRRRARGEAERAAARLRSAGWNVRTDVRSGAPLAGLLAAVADEGADLLVVGARATRGLQRALLGSVAEGALDRSPVPVLVVR